MIFKITVPSLVSLFLQFLILSGIGAADIAKLKANGIHTVGVRVPHKPLFELYIASQS
jgi:hypothetical protein